MSLVPPDKTEKVSLWEIFTVFLKIGAFTIGGGYMMVPAIQEEISRRRWIPEDELPDMVAVSQSAPGLLTVNMAIFCGFRLRGTRGSIVATLGSILAPFIMILVIAMFFNNFSSNPVVARIFKGVRPVAVAIIAAYGIRLASRNTEWWHWAITIITVGCIAFLKISAVYVLLTVLAVTVAMSLLNHRKLWK